MSLRVVKIAPDKRASLGRNGGELADDNFFTTSVLVARRFAILLLGWSIVFVILSTFFPISSNGNDLDTVSERKVSENTASDPELINRTAVSNGSQFRAPLLPQDFPYQIDLYQWLKSLTITDVSLPVGASVSWAGFSSGTDDLARLWVETLRDGDNNRSLRRVTVSEPKWYVLDDGAGAGIEGYGLAIGDNMVRKPAMIDRSGGSKILASEAAWWYQWNIPLSGGGQGNPLYRHRGIGNRALVLAAIDLMMLDEAIYTGKARASWGDRTDFIGGYLISVATAYKEAKDLLDNRTRQAFETGMQRLVDRMLELGAKDVNSNMDGKAVEGCAVAYGATTNNSQLRSSCIRLAKLVLFGKEQGSITDLDSDAGIFYLEGLVREADGPPTSYNGRSIAHLAAARAHTVGSSDWNFLDEVLPRMCDFIFYQYTYQPGSRPRTQTPDGYSNRTAGGMKNLQDTPWGRLTLALLYPECRPFAMDWKFMKAFVVKPTSLPVEIERRIKGLGNILEYADTPPVWSVKEPWPKIVPFLPPSSNWYSTLRNYIETGAANHVNHPARSFNFSRTFPASLEAGNDWQTGVQWWAYRSGQPGNQFGYFIESTIFSGTFSGYFSGKIEHFWREGQGPVILSKREPKKLDYGWGNVDKWRIEHTWGIGSDGKAFSWSKVNGDKSTSTPSSRTVEWNGTLTITTPFEDRGREAGSLISGSLTQTKRFRALSNGIEVRTDIFTDQENQIKELWLSIPLYEGGEGDPNAMPSAFKVEYESGTSWTALNQSLTTTGKVRVGHDWDNGFVFTYIYFDSPVTLRLLSADTQLDRQRIHLLQIDLIGNPGASRPFPAISSVTYSVTTSDGQSSQSPLNQAPIVSVRSPASGTSFEVPGSITISADASDPDGSVTVVEFFANGVKIGQDSSWPYTLSWNLVPVGEYDLTAVAVDNDGTKSTSISVIVFVVQTASQNAPPIVTITNPAAGSSFQEPAVITISVDASDPDGSVSVITFFANGVKIGETDANSPSMTWTDVSAAEYELTASATDDLGAQTISLSVNVSVAPEPTGGSGNTQNQAPLVSISFPDNGASFVSPANIQITAVASDPDGDVVMLKFYANGLKIGEVPARTPMISWNNVPAGNYELYVRAKDNDGRRTNSSIIIVSVNDPLPPPPPPVTNEQTLDLSQGWNLVSLTVALSDLSIPAIFGSELGNVVVIQDDQGRLYDSSSGTNTIGDWDLRRAYMVNVRGPVSIVLEGEPVEPQTNTIDLEPDWNLVPFIGRSSLAIADALRSILADLIMAKDQAGKIYYPEYGIDDIVELVPGHGYKIKVRQATTLVFPSGN